MYTGYKLNTKELHTLIKRSSTRYIQIACEHYDKIKESLHKKMAYYLKTAYDNETKSVQMKNIENDFFPDVQCHVFLSHSSKDRNYALALAGYLWENCRINVFIDSMLWNYCDELLKALDDKFSSVGYHKYNYDNRNITTAQVHVLLNMALAKMIDRTECFIFLESPNSINPVNRRITSRETESPWIYSELLLAEMIQKRHPEYHRMLYLDENFSHSDASKIPHFIYDAMLDQLHPLSSSNIIEATRKCQSDFIDYSSFVIAENFLDNLYEITGVKRDE